MFFLFSQPRELHFTCFLIMVNKRKHVKIHVCISIDENTHSRHSHVTFIYQNSTLTCEN